jgi:MFS family permease
MAEAPDAGPRRSQKWLTKDVALISLSAFFADMGYQAVTAVFPIIVVLELKQPAYVYGLLLSLSYGVGSVFALLGGRLGDRYDKKSIAIAGNLLIPLMSFSVLFSNTLILGSLFILGWWARYFRTPPRRAWLVEVSNPSQRSKIFGFLHALDVGGGMIAVAYSVALVLAGFSLRDVVLVTTVPLLLSTLSLALAGTKPDQDFARLDSEGGQDTQRPEGSQERTNDFAFKALILSTTLFGFSYYALGFPIVTVAQSQNSSVLGVATFGVYLGVSAAAGYLLGSYRAASPLRTLWTLGYILASLSSLVVGLSYAFNYGLWLYYLGAAGLGFATGSVETFEPVLISTLVKARRISSGMGWLSSGRAIGLFVSNAVMGFLFTYSEFGSYLYAAVAAAAAGAILLVVEFKTGIA